MEVDIFHALVNKLREKEYLTDTIYVSVEEQIAIFLYTVAKNATNETLQDWFQHSPDTIHRYFKAVLEAVTNLTSVYIRAPSLHPHPIGGPLENGNPIRSLRPRALRDGPAGTLEWRVVARANAWLVS
ncbi:hypothetical protein OsJ_26391 [Oryza sativa Japonica Group]|nr:hypothetical protein OsJ_26391 [Oryza sativa Japonica Group]